MAIILIIFNYGHRLVEEGKLDEAEPLKQQLEQQQRERKKLREADGITHIPMWFRYVMEL